MTPVKLYGRPGSPQAHAIRDFLYRSDVPFEWIEHEKDTPVCVFSDGTRLEMTLHNSEQQLIEKALQEAAGRVSGPSGAAARLGVPASTLESKIKRFKIDKFRYRVGND
ncbi:MAG: hypothetical protein AUH72_07425 [Acidobacteria bacterium 13_1_40CM_4_65_8]|nr:MAG: hypothetical protein AUH72_07425 [Acidobacteria bacterium 13_1_40CM_4_65_8]